MGPFSQRAYRTKEEFLSSYPGFCFVLQSETPGQCSNFKLCLLMGDGADVPDTHWGR